MNNSDQSGKADKLFPVVGQIIPSCENGKREREITGCLVRHLKCFVTSRSSGLSRVPLNSEGESKILGKAKSQSLFMFLKKKLLLVWKRSIGSQLLKALK